MLFSSFFFFFFFNAVSIQKQCKEKIKLTQSAASENFVARKNCRAAEMVSRKLPNIQSADGRHFTSDIIGRSTSPRP